MTAEEALKLSKTGIVWDTHGYPAIRVDNPRRWVWALKDIAEVEVPYPDEHDWFPDAPHLRNEETPVKQPPAEPAPKTFSKDEVKEMMQAAWLACEKDWIVNEINRTWNRRSSNRSGSHP